MVMLRSPRRFKNFLVDPRSRSDGAMVAVATIDASAQGLNQIRGPRCGAMNTFPALALWKRSFVENVASALTVRFNNGPANFI